MTSLLALDAYLHDWLDLLLRWLHVIAAIAWIGTSFYFVLLDQSLRAPADPTDAEAGVAGELWEVHGGGFYHVQKYRVAPPTLPEHLAWFKWEAYTTWLTGFALVVLLFYLDGASRLVDPAVADLSQWQAVALSLVLLVGAWVVYDVFCRLLGRNERVLAASVGVLAVASAIAATELFASRAAFLQVGAMLGTIMAANVLMVIIPAHWELIRAKEAGREPDPTPGIEGKRRSVHNNYLTLPVLFTMLGGHFPLAYGASHAWLVLAAFMALGVFARLFFNLRHRGRTNWWMPVAGAAVVAALGVALNPDDEASATGGDADAFARGKAVFASAGCGACHTLADAGTTGTVGPSLDATKPPQVQVVERVTNGKGAMPAFRGKLTEQQISDVAVYVSAVVRGATP
ncbi:MAG: urate hydroxylase PuuD [Gaiellales bacterium]